MPPGENLCQDAGIAIGRGDRPRAGPVRRAMAHGMRCPMAEADLSRFERWALALGRLANESSRGKSIQESFLRRVTYPWVYRTLSTRMFVDGMDMISGLAPDRGVLMVANHRSFFDQYAILLSFYGARVPWLRRMGFPVRSNFFYEHPLGILVNFAVGGGAMYPPIFRQAERTALNDDALDRIVRSLAEPGTLIGVHPEGTRGKGPDVYDLLPAQPGVGKMALLGKPIVIPAFINGLPNDIVAGTRSNYRPGIRQEDPCIIVYGNPVDYSDLLASKPRPTLYKKAADRFMKEVRALGERERELRAACRRGEIGDDHPGWLTNFRAAAAGRA
jgi:1-acyl-sn-glycerol-3-phosphate acyltransferase